MSSKGAPSSKAALPIISWENNCATKFGVWFGSDPDFTRTKKFNFTDTNPVDNGGTLSRVLTPGHWNTVRKLVNDQADTEIYWYVGSWDIVKRAGITKTAFLILEP